MNDSDQMRWPEERERGAPRLVTAPPRHEGIGRALRSTFSSPPALPEDWTRLLARLR